MKFQTAYMPLEERIRPGLVCEVETKTKQDEAAACDINNIMARYQRTGVIDHLTRYAPVYGELTKVPYEAAFESVQLIDDAFLTLPAVVREKYGNNPQAWIDAVEGVTEPDALRELLTGETPDPLPTPSPEPVSPSPAPTVPPVESPTPPAPAEG